MKSVRTNSIFNIFTLFALLASLLGSALVATPVRADSTITVNTTVDELNSNGYCSLREAIKAANTNLAVDTCTAGSGADTIILPAGTYTLTITGADEDANATGDLDITDSLTINGAGAGTTIIRAGTLGYPDPSANGIDRVFDVYDVSSAIIVSISNVTIANGKCSSCTMGGGGISNNESLTVTNSTFSGNSASGNSGNNWGGGIYTSGTLTVTNSTFSGNFATHGGGMFLNGGLFAVTNSTFSGNLANGAGGGIISYGTLTVTNSTFSGNSAASNGGGISSSYGTLAVTNSTFSGNSAFSGGGINNYVTLTVTNSAFSGNLATNRGGGINNQGTLTVTNSTFSGNSAYGGGINNFASLYLKNTILANSTGGPDCNNDGGDAIAVNINNLIETNGPSGHKCGTPAVTSDPGLGALADNGGPTQTFAITSASSAYNAGDNAVCSASLGSPNYGAGGLDQRGIARPQSGACDIGSYELDNAAPTVLSSTRVNPSPTSAPSVNYTVTFSEAVTNVDVNDFALTTTGLTGASVSAVSGSGALYTITVQTGYKPGTLRLDIPNTATITDLSSNSLAGLPFTTGETYTVEKNPTFADVPLDYWAWKYIESLYDSGITGGCSTNPLNYCPTSSVTRAQMAVFLLKGIHGQAFTPPAVNGSTGFNDVAVEYWAAAWIKQLAAEGITGGCGNSNYCPENTVTRDQMAVFLLKAKYGSSYAPPAVTDTGFTDVPTDYWAGAWIKQLAAEAITGGCGGGLYCPANPVTRDQMAVFLQKTFGLALP